MKPAKSRITYAADAATEARDLAEHMPLVYSTVARLLRRLPRSVQRDDLVAAGCFGLLDALRRSEQKCGPAFECYARTRIRGAIVDELRAEDWLSRRTRAKATAEQAEGGEPASRVRTAIVAIEDLAPGAADISDPNAVDALAMVAMRRENAVVAEAVETLPERERGIVKGYYFDGVPFKTIAATLGVSEPRVSQLHTRAMQMLRSKLESEDAAA